MKNFTERITLAVLVWAAIGVIPTLSTPLVNVASGAPCADPAMCQAPEPGTASVEDDAELRSEPDPAMMPQEQQPEAPWQVIGIPGR